MTNNSHSTYEDWLASLARSAKTFSWQAQAQQYPENGESGLSYFRGDMSESYGAGAYVDCLLWRNDFGELVGILNHYPQDFPPHEKGGNITVMVREDHRRRGIGRLLLLEANRRYEINWKQQNYTHAGLRLAVAAQTEGERARARNVGRAD